MNSMIFPVAQTCTDNTVITSSFQLYIKKLIDVYMVTLVTVKVDNFQDTIKNSLVPYLC